MLIFKLLLKLIILIYLLIADLSLASVPKTLNLTYKYSNTVIIVIILSIW